MKAVQLHGYGSVDELVYEEVPIPVALVDKIQKIDGVFKTVTCLAVK